MMTKANLVAFLDRYRQATEKQHDQLRDFCRKLPDDLKHRLFADAILSEAENRLLDIIYACTTLANQLAREVDKEAA